MSGDERAAECVRQNRSLQNQALTGTNPNRRQLLRQMLGMALGSPLCSLGGLDLFAQKTKHAAKASTGPPPLPPPGTFSPEDDQFLNDLEHASFLFFWEQTNPQTGLVKDRSNVRINDTGIVGSIASTGFALTAICIADKRGFISPEDARQRVLATLTFLWRTLPTHRGFFYHFANINTGERLWDSEVSSVDTAILLCGVLTCHAYFEDRQIQQLSREIFDRVDWTWLSEDTALLTQGWTPEFGFLPYKWDLYSELMMIYLLGMGSGTHPLHADAWLAWKRTMFEYDGLRYIGSFAPLFTHQFSQAWFDFRHKRDKFADYFQNSAVATDVHRRFCIEMNKRFPDYSDDLWGITASDSAKGYVIWGGPPAMGPIDGTVAPAAAGGSIPFLPDTCLRVLKTIKSRYPQAWTKYGFVDAFNPLTQWYDHDIVGIDAGIIMVMVENARSSFIWETFMKNPEAKRGMSIAGFTSYTPAT